MQERNVSFFAS